MNRIEIEKLFYIDKNYSKIKELLQNSDESWSFNMLAKIFLQEGDLNQAYNFFNQAKNFQGCGYCKFLTGNLAQAEIIMTMIKDSSPFANWILFLIDIIKCENKRVPTYFQIKNFYEQDLNMLYKAGQIEYAKKIIEKNNFLERYNKEIYKMTARVLMNNEILVEAQRYLKKSIDICYKDPETHYMLAEIYIKSANIEKARQEFLKCIEVSGTYLPAENRLKDLAE